MRDQRSLLTYNYNKMTRKNLTEILYDILVLQVLQQRNLLLHRSDHALFPFFASRPTHLEIDLLDGHEQTCLGVHAEVDLAEGTLTDKSSLYPFDGSVGYKFEKTRNRSRKARLENDSRHSLPVDVTAFPCWSSFSSSSSSSSSSLPSSSDVSSSELSDASSSESSPSSSGTNPGL